MANSQGDTNYNNWQASAKRNRQLLIKIEELKGGADNNLMEENAELSKEVKGLNELIKTLSSEVDRYKASILYPEIKVFSVADHDCIRSKEETMVILDTIREATKAGKKVTAIVHII